MKDTSNTVEAKFNIGKTIAIGAIILTFIGGITALIIWTMSTTTTSSSSPSPPPVTTIPKKKCPPTLPNSRLRDAIFYSNGSEKTEKKNGILNYCKPCTICASGSNYGFPTNEMCGVNLDYCEWEKKNPKQEQCSLSCSNLLKL